MKKFHPSVRSFHEGGNHPEEEVREDAAIRERIEEGKREGKREEESLSERGEREREREGARERHTEIRISIIAVVPAWSVSLQLTQRRPFPSSLTPHLEMSDSSSFCSLKPGLFVSTKFTHFGTKVTLRFTSSSREGRSSSSRNQRSQRVCGRGACPHTHAKQSR